MLVFRSLVRVRGHLSHQERGLDLFTIAIIFMAIFNTFDAKSKGTSLRALLSINPSVDSRPIAYTSYRYEASSASNLTFRIR